MVSVSQIFNVDPRFGDFPKFRRQNRAYYSSYSWKTPNLKFDPKPKFFILEIIFGLTDHFELPYVKICRIYDFLKVKLMSTGNRP